AVAQPTLPHLGNPGQMPPRAHQQPLRLSAFLEMPIGGEGAGEEAVVPAPHMQSRDIDTVEHGARRASPPIITAWWLVQPVAVERIGKRFTQGRCRRIDQLYRGRSMPD